MILCWMYYWIQCLTASGFCHFIFDLSFYGGIGTSYGKQVEPEDTVRRKMGTCVGRSARCDSAVRVFGSGIEPFAGRVITVGTLVAIYLSTSDEMLPILISESVPVVTIAKILGSKVIIAVLSGLIVELVYVRLLKKQEKEMDIHVVCEEEHCHCEDGIVVSALKHTVKIFCFIFLISLVLNGVIGLIGEEALSGLFSGLPVVGELIAALVGLIPNCASSVVITQLYLDGIIRPGAMMAGLLVNAGVGFLVLFRLNRDYKQNAAIIATMYVLGVLWGVMIEACGIVF